VEVDRRCYDVDIWFSALLLVRFAKGDRESGDDCIGLGKPLSRLERRKNDAKDIIFLVNSLFFASMSSSAFLSAITFL
jgi:hypothetical protein